MTAEIAGAFCLGGFAWTFAEYGIHNWVMHRAKGKNEFSRQHLNHHADPNDFARIWKKFAAEALVVAALFALAATAAGWRAGLSFAAGFISVYHLYEFIHERLHTHPPAGSVGRFLRRHHMIHHFAAPMMNHGVTFPLWDIVFGTLRGAGVIAVPSRHAPPWLVDPKTGEVRPEFAGDYRLRKAPASARQNEIDREAAFSNRILV